MIAAYDNEKNCCGMNVLTCEKMFFPDILGRLFPKMEKFENI
jgi:hypothetical protein